MGLEPLKCLKSNIIFHQEGDSHLVVFIHGRTGNLKMLEWLAKRFQISKLSYLSIQAPFEDLRPEQKPGEGFSWYLNGKKGLDESRGLIRSAMEELRAQGWKTEQIILLGFSQGAAMLLDLGLRGPYRFCGLLAISGFCLQTDAYPGAFGPHAKNQRILITHGTRDEIISLEKAETSYEVLRRYGIPFEFEVFDKPHSFHLQKEVPSFGDRLKAWMQP